MRKILLFTTPIWHICLYNNQTHRKNLLILYSCQMEVKTKQENYLMLGSWRSVCFVNILNWMNINNVAWMTWKEIVSMLVIKKDKIIQKINQCDSIPWKHVISRFFSVRYQLNLFSTANLHHVELNYTVHYLFLVLSCSIIFFYFLTYN